MSPAAAKTKRPPYADTVDAEPNHLHSAFADWLGENTGYEVDAKSVQLAATLSGKFRASDAREAADAAHTAAKEAEKEAKKQEKVNARIEAANKLRARADEILRAAGVDPNPAPAKSAAKPRTAKAASKAKESKPALASVPSPAAVDDDEF